MNIVPVIGSSILGHIPIFKTDYVSQIAKIIHNSQPTISQVYGH